MSHAIITIFVLKATLAPLVIQTVRLFNNSHFCKFQASIEATLLEEEFILLLIPNHKKKDHYR